MPTKQRVLEALSRLGLQQVGSAFDPEVDDKQVMLVEAVAASREVSNPYQRARQAKVRHARVESEIGTSAYRKDIG